MSQQLTLAQRSALTPPPRSKFGQGSKGAVVTLRANFLRMRFNPPPSLHLYDVTIKQGSNMDIPPALNRKVTLPEEGGRPAGQATAPAPARGGRGGGRGGRGGTARGGGASGGDAGREKGGVARNTFTVTLQNTATQALDATNLKKYLTGQIHPAIECPDLTTLFQAMDLVVAQPHAMELPFFRSAFYAREDGVQDIGGSVEVWRGVFQSVRPTAGQLLLNVDVANMAFFVPGNLAELMADELRLQRGAEVNDFQRRRAEGIWKGATVVTTHQGWKKNHKVFGFSKQSAERELFEVEKNGKKQRVTVAGYFKENYNYLLRFPKLPCIKNAKGNMIPVELCTIPPGQRYVRKLDGDQTANILKFAALPPRERENAINRAVKDRLRFQQNNYLKDFGIDVQSEMMQVKARRLEVPQLVYGANKTTQPADGVWNMRGLKVAQSHAPLVSWAVVSFASAYDLGAGGGGAGGRGRGGRGGGPGGPGGRGGASTTMEALQSMVRFLCNAARECGLVFNVANPPIIEANPDGDIRAQLHGAGGEALKKTRQRPQMIFVVLPGPQRSDAVYAEVKRVAETDIDVLTQCVKSDKIKKALFKEDRMYFANVCLKINAKLGGMNTYVRPQHLPMQVRGTAGGHGNGPVMFLGADVTHPAPGVTNQRSIAAVVGTTDASLVKYSAEIRDQEARTEIIDKFADMIVALIKRCAEGHAGQDKKPVLPQRIIMFRDGVGESQFLQVAENEITAMRKAFAWFSPGYQPKLTFVVLTKRHHARFFGINPNDMDRSGNVKAGTVIDSDCAHPRDMDFYLYGHAGLQGTSRPAKYHVLLDENNFKADELQELTYKSCYMYCRCTRSVSLTPSVYYAHLLSKRATYHTAGPRGDSDMGSVMSGGQGTMVQYAQVKPVVGRMMYFV